MRVWGDVTYDGKPVEEGSDRLRLLRRRGPGAGPDQGRALRPPRRVRPGGREDAIVVQINALKKTGKTIPNVMGDGAPTMDVLVNYDPGEVQRQVGPEGDVSSDSSKNQFDFKLEKSERSK